MFQIDPMSRTPIYEQIVAQTQRLVLACALQPHDQLPSVRSLSFSLSVNPNTIQKAYNDLCARGVVYAVPGKGCFVSPTASDALQRAAHDKLPAFRSLIKELQLAGISKDELRAELEKTLA